ncbi:MurR/RpiR family transcriptional regulator [Paenibacillus aestuarii]|uniref:MurR/RpiR family transcriptional regulator n=1 Tax=Paenibacillus aestuarii TaxID=516965 RepID=A0ABW0KBN9_9BACL|nr:MurR/RpiR family transcriptional regulator [Paenibacillus aestuarii]
MDNVTDRIRKYYNQLTNQQKIVAKFMLDEPKSVALHPAKVIGVMTETSEATVIRLSYALQYSGYTEMQNEIRQSLMAPGKQTTPAIDYLHASSDSQMDQDLIAYTLDREIAQIGQTLRELDREIINRAIQSILQAKKIVVVGLRLSHGAANWFSVALNILRGDTYLYRGPVDDTNYYLTEMDKDWLVIALSFPRYLQETVSFAKAAQQKGAQIIAITDNELSPVGQIADLLLKVPFETTEVFTGMPSIFSLLNVIVNGITLVDRENVEKRLRMYDESSKQFFPFFENS